MLLERVLPAGIRAHLEVMLRCVGFLAVLIVVTASFEAYAQTAGYAADKAELIRRVEAGEREGGFCATVKFPRRTVVDDYFTFLDVAVDGAEFFARSDYTKSGGCTYYRVMSASNDAGKKCRRMRSWACIDKGDQSGACFKIDRTWCHDGKIWSWKPD